jgi:hypothetical protein
MPSMRSHDMVNVVPTATVLRTRWADLLPPLLLLVLSVVASFAVATAASTTTTTTTTRKGTNPGGQQYLLIGVSGGLQDGFPDRRKLDYENDDEVVKAIFLGRALIRGYKAYLDVMQEGWRQYVPESSSTEGQQQPQRLINSNVFASGCYEHANQHFIYAVDARQFLTILLKEPRFLGITPDTGLVDLTSSYTSDLIQQISRHEIKSQNKANDKEVAFPLVTAIWYNEESHVESPPIAKDDDGITQITNFPESLALWAGVDDADRKACMPHLEDCSTNEASIRYWKGIDESIRAAEQNRKVVVGSSPRQGPPHFQCKKQARFGASKETAQINSPFTSLQLESLLYESGDCTIDYEKGILVMADGGAEREEKEL